MQITSANKFQNVVPQDRCEGEGRCGELSHGPSGVNWL